MKNTLLSIFVSLMLILSGCKKEVENKIVFGISAEYPPFEFHQYQQIKGFDIDLAHLIAQEMNQQAVFEDMPFNSVLAALENGTVDAAISTITITDQRKESFDFSDSYYEESVSVLYPQKNPIPDQGSLKNKKIACQLGSTMQIWLKNNALSTEVILMDSNNQSVEALKAGHVDGVLLDSVQAMSFAAKNPGLAHALIAKSENGYGIAVKKGSPLKERINHVLRSLKEKGELDRLKKKWLESAEWNP